MITQTELNAIKERAEKATAGSAPAWHTPKWYVDEEYPDTVRNAWDCELIAQSIPTIADAEFIAHAREDIPRLVAEIEWLREGLTYLTEAHHFDSPGQMAEVAEYYLNGGDD